MTTLISWLGLNHAAGFFAAIALIAAITAGVSGPRDPGESPGSRCDAHPCPHATARDLRPYPEGTGSHPGQPGQRDCLWRRDRLGPCWHRGHSRPRRHGRKHAQSRRLLRPQQPERPETAGQPDKIATRGSLRRSHGTAKTEPHVHRGDCPARGPVRRPEQHDRLAALPEQPPGPADGHIRRPDQPQKSDTDRQRPDGAPRGGRRQPDQAADTGDARETPWQHWRRTSSTAWTG